jgi:hypothetical protein
MVWNNLSFLNTTTDLTTVVGGVNTMSGGWLVGGLMITLFIISVMVFYGRVGLGEIFTGAGFIMGVVAALFATIGLLPSWVIGVCVSLMIIGFIILFMRNR